MARNKTTGDWEIPTKEDFLRDRIHVLIVALSKQEEVTYKKCTYDRGSHNLTKAWASELLDRYAELESSFLITGYKREEGE